MGMFGEFKEFINKGNALDLAVGVIIGGAFGKIVTALTDNILTPLIGAALGGVDLSSKTTTVGSVVLKYGLFIQAIIDFVLIAFVLFLIIRTINKMRRPAPVPPPPPPAGPTQEELLTEIRDLLKR